VKSFSKLENSSTNTGAHLWKVQRISICSGMNGFLKDIIQSPGVHHNKTSDCRLCSYINIPHICDMLCYSVEPSVCTCLDRITKALDEITDKYLKNSLDLWQHRTAVFITKREPGFWVTSQLIKSRSIDEGINMSL
jgi:hypothetical protein